MAASDLSTKFNSTNLMAQDGYYTFSNLGSCVDIFAPGRLSSSTIQPALLESARACRTSPYCCDLLSFTVALQPS